MPNIQRLVNNYTSYVKLPWQNNLSASESIWFAVYPPEKERSLLARLDEFSIETINAGKNWCGINLQGLFTEWLDQEDKDERDAMFASPGDLEFFAKEDLAEFLADKIIEKFETSDTADNTVFALYGLMELYDYVEVSKLIEELDTNLKGRLLVFFPGSKEHNTYRFMNARKGWDYLAVCIDSSQDLFL